MKTEYLEFKFLLLILIAITFLTINTNAQTDNEVFCATEEPVKINIQDLDCNPDPAGLIQNYWDIETYKPAVVGELFHTTPIKTIEVNFNIFQKSNGTGNYENTEEDKQRLIQMLGWVNDRFAHYAPTDDVPGVDVNELLDNDSRIRFSLGEPGQERIYYYPDDDLYCAVFWDEQKIGIETIDPERLNQLNICFTGGYYSGKVKTENVHITNHGTGYNSQTEVIFSDGLATATGTCTVTNGQIDEITVTFSGSYYGCAPEISFVNGGGTGAEAYCTLTGGYSGKNFPSPSENLNKDVAVSNFKNDGNIGGDASRAENTAHELAHTLDLHHVTSGGSCNEPEEFDDYLWDVFGLPYPGNCPHHSDCGEADDSPSDGCTNNIMGNKGSQYVSPRQAGIMHRTLALLSTRKYVRDDAYIATEPIVVTNNETWDFNIKLYRDIIVEAGAELTINCKVVMPWKGRIIVKPSAKLIIDGGTITTDAEGYLWKGIEVRGNINQH